MDDLNLEQAVKNIRTKYKEKITYNKTLSKLIDSKSVNRYINIMGYEEPKILFDEEIMENILINININDENISIYFNKGLYYVTGEDTIFEYKTLIKEEDVQNINDMIRHDQYKNQFVSNMYYEVVDGCTTYNTNSDNNVITLPSLNKITNKLNNFPQKNHNYKEVEEFYKRLKIARSQFYIMLINENMKYVLEYYNNNKNIQEIDNRIDEYIRKRDLKNK